MYVTICISGTKVTPFCLFIKKLGVLALLDEESRFPKGTDQTLLEKLHKAHEACIVYKIH